MPAASPLTNRNNDDGEDGGTDNAPGGWGAGSEDGGSVLVGSIHDNEPGEGSSSSGSRCQGHGSHKISKAEPSPSSELVANYLDDGFDNDEDYEEPSEDTSVSDAASEHNEFSDVEELDN
jgi:hypothetical protein